MTNNSTLHPLSHLIIKGGAKLFSRVMRLIKVLGLGLILPVLLTGCSHQLTGVLNPKGLVATQERKIMFDCIALMLIVVIPVIIMSFVFTARYRAAKNNPDYKPNWSHNTFLECIWWGVPCILIIILSVITWQSSHTLDPYRKLDMPGKTLTIQAVSLQWKWLFIYPKQNIATVNYIEIPKDQQVEFLITSDAPMSAFFIPQLGSQIYSMAGMRTRLHLVANHEGTFPGMNTQYNGDGFSEMKFKVKVTDQDSFNKWISEIKQKPNTLNIAAYQKLVKPTIASPAMYYSTVYPHLFKRIMEQFTKPNMRLH